MTNLESLKIGGKHLEKDLRAFEVDFQMKKKAETYQSHLKALSYTIKLNKLRIYSIKKLPHN